MDVSEDIEDIYFFLRKIPNILNQMCCKYQHLTSVNYQLSTSEITDNFNKFDEIFSIYRKKVYFLFIYFR